MLGVTAELMVTSQKKLRRLAEFNAFCVVFGGFNLNAR
jgi:hypothetical protein